MCHIAIYMLTFVCVMSNCNLKTFSGIKIKKLDLYIYIYCRKFSAKFNKLIKTVGHRARCFEFVMLNTPTLPTNLTLFGYFHILTYQVLKL